MKKALLNDACYSFVTKGNATVWPRSAPIGDFLAR